MSPSLAVVKALALGCVLLIATNGIPARAQAPAGYELALVDLEGKKQVLGTLPPSVFAPRLSPDGKRVAFELDDPRPADVTADSPANQPATMRLWVAEVDHLDRRRVLPLIGKGRNWAAVWSTNGERLVFASSGNANRQDALYWRRADGTGEAEHLIDARAAEGIYASDQQLAFITLTGNRDYGISVLDMKTKAVTRLIDYPDSEQHSSRISPNGRWITYVSNETGQQEVWLEPLPRNGQRVRVTTNGGRHPLWSPDGSHLFYDQGGKMFRVRLTLSASPPAISEPETLPIQGFQQGDLRRQFDLMPDGRRLLMLFPLPAGTTSPGRP